MACGSFREEGIVGFYMAVGSGCIFTGILLYSYNLFAWSASGFWHDSCQ